MINTPCLLVNVALCILDASFRRGDHHRGPNSIETMLDPDNLCRIWSREEELEALSHTEIERDETIKQLDEFGSKEVTFY